MIVHDKGPKAERDRRLFLNMCRNICKEFKIKPLAPNELAKIKNWQMSKLCEDIYNNAPSKAARWYAEKLGRVKRSGEFKVRWFFRDLFGIRMKV